ncbi:hypothetical protein HYFRA_00000851 [Hymenoscyphus fraxineus]|uniref:Uncharacterized protein n=1 Tax=Hymenoscyphus fraxineus TaxID=746836 RepID=A0A9N9KSD2_9HELO|nr:hypothetical protein HYFRA_00000851 [Hymenoscyphus fraxineus]
MSAWRLHTHIPAFLDNAFPNMVRLMSPPPSPPSTPSPFSNGLRPPPEPEYDRHRGIAIAIAPSTSRLT